MDYTQEKAGFELRDLAKIMKEEGITKLQTANCCIEMHPSFLERKFAEEKEEKRFESDSRSSEEIIANAKMRLNNMLGGL